MIQAWIAQLVAHQLGDWDHGGPDFESHLEMTNSLKKVEQFVQV